MMKRYFFIFLCAFVALLVSCHRKDGYCPELDGVRLFPENCDYKEILKKKNIRFFNNPIYDEGDLDLVLCNFYGNFCRYPKDGNDYWHSSYMRDKLNKFKNPDGQDMFATVPRSYCAYMAEIWALARYASEPCDFGYVSLYFDRDDIVFYDCDSIVISSNLRRKETFYAYKPNYIYNKFSQGDLTWEQMREMGYHIIIGEMRIPGFYSADSIETGKLDVYSDAYEAWWGRYRSIRDSIVTTNRLYEKTPLKECMLYYNRKENIIKDFYGNDIPDEITSNRTLKRFFSESFKFSDKASFLRIPFVIRTDTIKKNL